MREDALTVRVLVDPQVNAATLVFVDIEPGSDITDYAIYHANGDVIAVVTFSTTGQLAQIQLLDADTQLAQP